MLQNKTLYRIIGVFKIFIQDFDQIVQEFRSFWDKNFDLSCLAKDLKNVRV
jgi:hypothetical protein